MSHNLRPEYPRPILQREQRLSLNGEWDFAIGPVTLGASPTFDEKIMVPFAVNSALSGVVDKCYRVHKRLGAVPAVTSN